MKITDIMFSHLRNALFGTEADEQTAQKTTECADTLYKLSKHHDVAHLVSYAIEKNKIQLPVTELSKKFRKRHPIAVIRYEAMDAVYTQLCETLENEKIPFVPLKGSVIRKLYPEPWMRTSCDIDILVREEDLENTVLLLTEKYGFEKSQEGTHEISLYSKSGIHIELHYRLHEDFYKSSADEILKCVWSMAEPVSDGSYMYELNDELFYFYHVYHMAKHFEVGGCGIRPFIDMWLLNHNVSYNGEKRDELLEKGGIKKFEESCRALSEYWFSETEKTELVKSLEEYILAGGVYGVSSNSVAIRQSKSGGKVKYVLERLFLPYDMLKVHYPVLNKHKYLTPVFEVVRWFRLLSPATLRRSKREMELGNSVSDAKSEKLKNLLMDIGLK